MFTNDFSRASNLNTNSSSQMMGGEIDSLTGKSADAKLVGNNEIPKGRELEVEGLKETKKFFRNNDLINLISTNEITEVDLMVQGDQTAYNQLVEIPNFVKFMELFGGIITTEQPTFYFSLEIIAEPVVEI